MQHLKMTFGRLPPKSNTSAFAPKFLEKRRVRLQRWLEVVLLHPVRSTC